MVAPTELSRSLGTGARLGSEPNLPTRIHERLACHPGTTGKFDLCAHFFRRADALLGRHGAIGLIATNTIAQGDTRATGLRCLVAKGHAIYDAVRSLMWPGEAAVSVSVVLTAKGCVAEAWPSRLLDGKCVQCINSGLRPKPERPDPRALHRNEGSCFQGSIVLGTGFVLEPDERERLVEGGRDNAERIVPYLGGEEVNNSPTQDYRRYVISFGQMELEEAERWPDLLAIVRERVKPERELVRRAAYRERWWRFAEPQTRMRDAIRPMRRCLVNSQVSKHLLFAFQPTDRMFAHTLYVYPLPDWTQYAILQSRVHEPWARLLSSSMKNDLRYAASDCFDTFPFPKPDPRTVLASLEDIGGRLYETRAKYMVDSNQGLTQTYNKLKDADCTESRIQELRDLHLEMDRAVLAAYCWSDISVPPYTTPTTPEEEKALETFQDEIIDRLFVLNAQRAEEEKLAGLAKVTKKAKPKAKTPARSKKVPANQLSLLKETK